MNTLILTVGTRGDVQIYIGLAQKLNKSGYSVTIATSRAHEKLITGLNINYECIDETTDTGLINNVIQKKGMKAIKEGIKLLFDGMYQSHTKIINLIPHYDLIIGHGWLGETESDLCNKKFIRVGISPNIAEKEKTKTNSFSKKLMIDIETYALNQLILKPYNDFRKIINAKPTNLSEIYKKPLFIPISKVLLVSLDLWNNNTYQSSYWYTDYSNYTPPEDLKNLLSNGKKNILVNFGSMTTGLNSGNTLINIFSKISDIYGLNIVFLGKNIQEIFILF